jgi:hypothetical protein
MESKKRAGEPVSWVKPVLECWEKFPLVTHDEFVDTGTQAVIYLKDTNWLSTPVHEEERDNNDYADDERRRSNPYAA